MHLELPPLSEYEQSLVQMWFSVGTVKQTSGGLLELEWGEIIKWATHFYKDTQIEMVEHPRHSKRHKRTYTPVVIERCSLVDWELEQIKKLSQEYVAEYSQASDPARPCPTAIFMDEVPEEEAMAASKKLGEAFKLMFNPIES